MILQVCVSTGHIMKHEISGNDLNAIKFNDVNGKFSRVTIMDVSGNETSYNWDQVIFMNLGMQGKAVKTDMRL